MSLLNRIAIIINRKQPYIDWANGFDEDGPKLTADFGSRESIYLVPVDQGEETIAALLAAWWTDIFEEELAAWMRFEDDWPPNRTREMFDAWFDATTTDTVIDLAPDEPLTDDDLDAEDVELVIRACAWCGREFGDENPRTEGFTIDRRDLLEEREGRTLSLFVQKDRVLTGLVTARESQAALRGDDLVFRVCNRECAQPLKKLVPPALRTLLETIQRRS